MVPVSRGASSETEGTPLEDDDLAPHSLEAEEATLGAVFLSVRVLPAIRRQLSAEDFYRERHRLIFRAIEALDDAGSPVDVLSVCEWLSRDGSLDSVGGAPKVDGLAASVPAAAHASHYASIVARLARCRAIVNLCYEAHALASNGDVDGAEGVLKAEALRAGWC
jgi:replicative DNA helicase